MSHLLHTATLGGLCTLLVACQDNSPMSPTNPTASEPGTVAAVIATGTTATFSGVWRSMQPLPTQRKWMGVGVLDKSIVVVGGWTGHTTLTRVDAYNVETRTWIQLRSLPAPRELVLGATAINGKLYVAGGRSADAMNREEKTLFVYDPGTNTWSRKADMPRAAAAGVQVNIGGRLYVYAGMGGQPDDVQLFASYNPSTNRWVRLPPPLDRDLKQGMPVAGVINGKLYLTGGIDALERGGSPLYVYDPIAKTWTTKSPMPTRRDATFAAVFHGKLFVAGGLLWGGGLDYMVPTDVVEAYDPVTNTWSTGPAMLVARSQGGSAWAGGKFYTLGGVENLPIGLSNRVQALSTSY